MEDHVRAVPEGGVDLGDRRPLRHEDGRLDPEQLGRQRHALRVVARGRRDHAVGALLVGEPGDPGVGAAHLERARALEVLALEPHLAAAAGREPAGALHGRADRDAVEQGRGFLDVGERTVLIGSSTRCERSEQRGGVVLMRVLLEIGVRPGVRLAHLLEILLQLLLGVVLAHVRVLGEVLDDGVDRGRERHGDEGAGDPRHDDADADRDDHPERVQRDPAAHQERLEDVPLDLLDQDHPAEHEQGGDRPLVDQGDQDRDGPGHGGADHRHERAQEDQHADGEHERHPEDGRHQGDADGIDQRHDDGRTDELGQRDPGHPAGAVDAGPRRPGSQPDGPRPDPLAVGEEEVRREQHDEEAREDVGDRAAERRHLGEDLRRPWSAR